MPASISCEIKGLRELQQTLRRLPQQVQQRVMKGALATGCSVIRREAMLRAPEATGKVSEGHPPPGTLKKAIYQTRLVGECTSSLEVWKVDVRKGRQVRAVMRGGQIVNMDAYYASWVEYGHYTAVTRGASGHYAGSIRIGKGAAFPLGSFFVMPRPFMRPAFESQKEAAVRAMAQYIAGKLPDALDAARAS